jgi:exodeoxyribonuclease-3
MRLLSWNVNGVRAIERKGFLSWLAKESPDILCLQETKSSPESLSEALRSPLNYQVFWSSAERKGYSGVAVYTPKPPKSIRDGLGVKEFDIEGRTLILEYDNFVLFNIYFPNGGSGNKRVSYKMSFYETFLREVEKQRKQNKSIIICGDVNTAHTEIDLARPKQNEKNTGFLPEERAWMTKFL